MHPGVGVNVEKISDLVVDRADFEKNMVSRMMDILFFLLGKLMRIKTISLVLKRL